MPGLGATGGGKFSFSVGWRQSTAKESFVRFKENHSFTHNWQPRESLSVLDVSARYAVNRRVSITASLPIVNNSFSMLYPPQGVERGIRHFQSARGIGDLVLFGQTFILDPKEHPFGNVAAGVGMKVPTGQWNMQRLLPNETGQDFFKRTIYPPAIMPGDGGTDIILGVNGFKNVRSNKWLRGDTLFFNASYMISPRNHNGTNSIVQSLGVPLAPQFGNMLYNSVTDAYNIQLGCSFNLPHVADRPLVKAFRPSLSFDWQGIPKYDLFGGTTGYRQPGYTISVAPGATYTYKRNMFIVQVPLFFNRYIDPHDTTVPGLPTVSAKGVLTPAPFSSTRNLGMVAPAGILIRYVRSI